MAGYVTPISVVMPSKILSAIVIWAAPKLLGKSTPAILTDYQIITNQGLDFGVLPIGMPQDFTNLIWLNMKSTKYELQLNHYTFLSFTVMFFVCIGIVLIVGSIAWTCVLVFGNVAQKTVLRYDLKFCYDNY